MSSELFNSLTGSGLISSLTGSGLISSLTGSGLISSLTESGLTSCVTGSGLISSLTTLVSFDTGLISFLDGFISVDLLTTTSIVFVSTFLSGILLPLSIPTITKLRTNIAIKFIVTLLYL